MLANMEVWLPGMQCAAAGSVNAVTGFFALSVRTVLRRVGRQGRN